MTRADALLMASLLLLVAFSPAPIRSLNSPLQTVPRLAGCACYRNGTLARPFPPAASGADPLSYNEQLGMTFTQSFTSLAYNVTAVEQVDPVSDLGPAYLLNGLSDRGYWYQVGLSWNWFPNHYPGTGFDMNYEVFDASGNSIFPVNGGGGLAGFSGTVNAGDTVLLNLYLSGTSIVMLAKDYNTGASASRTYSAEGAVRFEGLGSSPSNANGFFTGLMTEWYHSSAYYGNPEAVTYSNLSFALTSAWMWADEFSCSDQACSNPTLIFSDSTPQPVAYSVPDVLQAFSSNGATLYSNAYKFITGTTGLLALTVDYSLSGGGTPLSSPILTYVSEGSPQSATLAPGQNTYQVDYGSSWSVTSQLLGHSAGERWATNTLTSGIAYLSETVNLNYVRQYLDSFTYNVTGGGAGYSPPVVSYLSFGLGAQSAGGGQVWVDAGSTYSFSNPLPGSSQTERWAALQSSGTTTGTGSISAEYFHQFAFQVSFSVTGGAPIYTPVLTAVQFGRATSVTMTSSPVTDWLDNGQAWSVNGTLPGALAGERWITSSTNHGDVTAPTTLAPQYAHQYYLTTKLNSVIGGNVSSSGWYGASQPVVLNAQATPGWQFQGWTGSGAGSYTGNSTSTTVTMAGPFTEAAAFYPGLTIDVAGSGIVSYGDFLVTGQTGGSTTIYVAPGSNASLTAIPSSFLYEFNGWSGASPVSSRATSVNVTLPATIRATFGYNYVVLGAIAAVVLLVASGLALALRRPRRSKPSGTVAAQTSKDTTNAVSGPATKPEPTQPAVPKRAEDEPPKGEQPKATKYCIECGATLPRSAKFCSECGTTQG